MWTSVQSKILRIRSRAAAEAARDADRDAWERTDRPLHYPARSRPPGSVGSLAMHGDSARARWLEANDIHTEFLDAGIGCCWFAYHGDEEPVSGETEMEAIERLARENGWELWSDAGPGKAAEHSLDGSDAGRSVAVR